MGVDRSIRACVAIRGYPPEFSGHGIQIQRSLPYLEREGIEVTILTQKLEGSPAHETDDPRVHRALSRQRSMLGTGRRVLELREFLRRHHTRIDVLHSAMQGWEFLVNVPYAKHVGLPIVYEMVILDGDDPATIARSRVGRLKLRLMKHVDAWVGLSGLFRPRVESVGLSADRFSSIPGGVEVDRYHPSDPSRQRALRERLGLPRDARIVVSVGSVIRRKGMDRMIAAWKRVGPQAGRDLLLIVGPDRPEDRVDPAFVAEIRREAEGPALKGTVQFTGRVENVEQYLGASDVFAFLSRKEGLGYVILEAMASGLPCVVSPLDGISAEVIEQGRTGYIVPDPDDAAEVARTLRSVLGDEELRQTLGRAGRRVVEERFSMEARARSLRKLYEGLVARRSARE